MLDDSDYIYTIGEHLVFNPKENKVINRVNKKQTTLYLTCSRCLSILLDNKDSVVSQKDILEFTWPDNHRDVSYNTFYQCVLNLRKAFLQIDFMEKIIITVPKKGLTIAPSLMISKVENNHVSSIVTYLESGLAIINSVNETDTENHEKSLITNSVVNKKDKSFAILILLATLVLVVTGSSYYYLNDNFFKNYTEYSSHNNNCHIYINYNESSTTKSEDFLEHEKDICKDNRYVYLTLYQNTKRVSAIACKRRINYLTNNSCVSYYYPAYEKMYEESK